MRSAALSGEQVSDLRNVSLAALEDDLAHRQARRGLLSLGAIVLFCGSMSIVAILWRVHAPMSISLRASDASASLVQSFKQIATGSLLLLAVYFLYCAAEAHVSVLRRRLRVSPTPDYQLTFVFAAAAWLGFFLAGASHGSSQVLPGWSGGLVGSLSGLMFVLAVHEYRSMMQLIAAWREAQQAARDEMWRARLAAAKSENGDRTS